MALTEHTILAELKGPRSLLFRPRFDKRDELLILKHLRNQVVPLTMEDDKLYVTPKCCIPLCYDC